MGVATDHEAVEHHEGLAKARLGIKLLMREGSGAEDVAELVRTYTEHKIDAHALAFCADLASTEKLVKDGSVDQNIRVAIANGVPPLKAIQMATINVAEIFYAQHDIGVLAPGRYADILFVDELPSFSIDTVIFNGEVMVDGGEFVGDVPQVSYPSSFHGTVQLSEPVTAASLQLIVEDRESVDVRVIGVTDGSLGTHELRATLKVVDGAVRPDFELDVLPLAMIDRFRKGTGTGLGFVTGFGLRRGAIASSVNAVCENLIVVGTNAEDMAIAVNHLADVGGGKIVVADGEILALAELRLLGLISDDPLEMMTEKFDRTLKAIAGLGCTLKSPFSQLEFCCACGEIGDIKLSEEGLVLLDPPRIVDVVLA
jgi:adenine deaminase